MFSQRFIVLVRTIAFATTHAVCACLPAQNEPENPYRTLPQPSRIADRVPAKRPAQRNATIHWQRVPLRDAIGRIHNLFDEFIFLDRRVDPSARVSLDTEAGSAEEVITAIATDRELSSLRMGRLIYLGPSRAADQLRAVLTARSQDVRRLPDLRASLNSQQSTTWPRLSEPRRIIASLIEKQGWRIANPEKIPHDLWAAGELPEMKFAEQLTVLLIGFDLTFKFLPNERLIEVITLNSATSEAKAPTPANHPVQRKNAASKKGEQHVYTLRVQEQPVRTVLQKLSTTLHWPIQIDEETIRAAGGSLDKRVSFSVENADREHLLEALLSPAGLDYRIEDDKVRIIPRRYDEK